MAGICDCVSGRRRDVPDHRPHTFLFEAHGASRVEAAVYAGVAVSGVTCYGAFLLFRQASNQALWEGILAIVAAAFVTSLLVYMKRVSAQLKKNIETRIEARTLTASRARALWGVFLLTLLMITREGMETALMISTALFQIRSATVTLGLALGLAAAITIGLAWTRLGRAVNLKALLNVFAVFLSIFVAQLLLYGIHELSEARVLPASEAISEATEILGPDGRIGHLMTYFLAIVPTVWLVWLWLKRRRAGAEGPSLAA